MLKGRVARLVAFTVLVALVGISLVGCSKGQAPAQQPGAPATPAPAEAPKPAVKAVTLRLGHEQPDGHPYDLAADKFAELVDKKSNGTVKVVIYPAAQLGAAKVLNEMVSTGQLDLSLTWTGVLEAFDKDLGLLILPYLWRDYDHQWKALDGPVGQDLFKVIESKGIKVLTCLSAGRQSFWSRKPVIHPSDMKNLKGRCAQSQVQAEVEMAVGAVVAPLPANEVYSALQTGAVDGLVQSSVNMQQNKYYEVAKHVFDSWFNYMLEPMLMNTKVFDGLAPEQQKAITDAAAEAGAWARAMNEQQQKEADEWLQKEGGCTFHKVDEAEWIAAMQSVYDKHPEWKDMVAKIKAVK